MTRRFSLVISLTIGLIFCAACGTRYEMIGASMEPTLKVGQYVTVKPVSADQIERGDLIVYKDPIYSEDLHIKRLIALPGETVEITDGRVFIDDWPLQEDYELISILDSEQFGPILVEQGMYFVLGDNRSNSRDSRAQGSIGIEDIIGRVVIR